MEEKQYQIPQENVLQNTVLVRAGNEDATNLRLAPYGPQERL